MEAPQDSRARYYLGNLFYDRGRRTEAISQWEKAARADASFATVWRNLGIAYFNVAQNFDKARSAYQRALRANPQDARVLYERDQLWKRLGEQPGRRLKELERNLELVRQRDDLSAELCALYNRKLGSPSRRCRLFPGYHFQPWEGGEGQALDNTSARTWRSAAGPDQCQAGTNAFSCIESTAQSR